MIDSYIPSRPVSLYIHVPFCRHRCDYCAFYSSILDIKKIDDFYLVLKKELELVTEEIHNPFYTIYFGGGNPILLGVDRIKALLEVATKYGNSKECTIEINPEDISEELEGLFPYLQRISTGIQSMNDSTLSFLNRRARGSDNIKAMEYLSSSPFIWNADLITAVPGTDVGDTLYDIEKVALYNPEHISFYCLTFEENTPLIKRSSPLGEEKEMDFLLSGWQKLRKLGYNHYEISAFCRPGFECKHNMVYWNLGQYIGLGPSAESYLGYIDGVTMRNKEDIDSYLESPDFDCERLSKKETEESYLLTSLRTSKGIDKNEYCTRFSSSFDETYREAISHLDEKWYENSPSFFHLTEDGMMMLNTVILTLSMVI